MRERGEEAGATADPKECATVQRARARQLTFDAEQHRAVERDERGGNARHSERERPRVRQRAEHNDVLGEGGFRQLLAEAWRAEHGAGKREPELAIWRVLVDILCGRLGDEGDGEGAELGLDRGAQPLARVVADEHLRTRY